MNIPKSLIVTGVTVLILIFGALLYRGLFWTFVDNYEFAYRFDALGGKVEPMVNPDGTPTHGYVFAWPLVERIHTIDTTLGLTREEFQKGLEEFYQSHKTPPPHHEKCH